MIFISVQLQEKMMTPSLMMVIKMASNLVLMKNKQKKKKKKTVLHLALFLVSTIFCIAQSQTSSFDDEPLATKKIEQKLTIKKIIVSGNKHIKSEVILNRIPYKVDDVFDQEKSGQAIRNLYALDYFRQIKLEGEKLGKDSMSLHVIVEEKKLLEKLEFKGNKRIKSKKIKEKFNLDKLTTVDEESLRRIAIGIQKMYAEENRYHVNVTSEIVPNAKNPDKATAIFTVQEGPKSTVVRVFFKGNKNMPERKLRNILLTRENWLLNFMDNAGTYQEELLDMDKHRIEYYYRDHGYLEAKVVKTQLDFLRDKKDVHITFTIKEGQQYYVREIQAPGDEMFSQEELLPLISLEKNQPFSQTKLVQSLNKLKDLWGERGYIYADVYPQVKPDEETRTVDVTFFTERGKKLYVNRINITGNKVTRDKVIRRQFDIAEGDLITTTQLSKSRAGVEYLSFFERDGVNWKVHRISDDLADLEMNVQEAKTGNLNFMLTYGSDRNNPKPSLRGAITIEKGNLFGKGYDVGAMIQASRHRIQKLEAHFSDPHILDSDVSGHVSVYKRWDEYDQWGNVSPSPIQKVLGGDVHFGFWLPQIDKRLQLILDIGIEDIRNNKPKAIGPNRQLFEPIVRRSFQEGTLFWQGADLVKDTRDHQVYPRSGYKMTLSSKIAFPVVNKEYSFLKAEAEGSSYIALIGHDSLVLGLHGRLGHVGSLETKKPIPYKELFHMGGQSTVRGFTWGGIGPALITGDPIGARNAIQWNAEFIFPLIPDYSMRGHFFYDAGAGWNTPKEDITDLSIIKRDSFDLRHAVGFGLNLVKPMPAKIDWGFKLDRKKRDGESAHEFHLSMNYAW
jgi:outer membrane protein insertion porin family